MCIQYIDVHVVNITTIHKFIREINKNEGNHYA